jgi:hypothetical protein
MDIVHPAGGDKDFRIGVSEPADVVGVFNARVRYQYLTADPIGSPIGDWQHYSGHCHGGRQQRQKEGAWLDRQPFGPKVP